MTLYGVALNSWIVILARLFCLAREESLNLGWSYLIPVLSVEKLNNRDKHAPASDSFAARRSG